MTRYVKICPGCEHQNPTSANNCEVDGEPLIGVNTQAEPTVARQMNDDGHEHDEQGAIDVSTATVSQPTQAEQVETEKGHGVDRTSRYFRKCPNCGHLNRADAWTCEADDTFLGSVPPELEAGERVEGDKKTRAEESDNGQGASNRNVMNPVQVGLGTASTSARRTRENPDNDARGPVATNSGEFPKRPQFASSSKPAVQEQSEHTHRPGGRTLHTDRKVFRRLRGKLPAITRKRIGLGLVIVASMAANMVLLYAWHPWSASQDALDGYTATNWITSGTLPETREEYEPPSAGTSANGYQTYHGQLAKSQAATVPSTPARPTTSEKDLRTAHSEQFATGTEIYHRYIGENP